MTDDLSDEARSGIDGVVMMIGSPITNVSNPEDLRRMVNVFDYLCDGDEVPSELAILDYLANRYKWSDEVLEEVRTVWRVVRIMKGLPPFHAS